MGNVESPTLWGKPLYRHEFEVDWGRVEFNTVDREKLCILRMQTAHAHGRKAQLWDNTMQLSQFVEASLSRFANA